AEERDRYLTGNIKRCRVMRKAQRRSSMAGTESSEKPVLTLKLLVDKKKNKVVLAEAGKEFVNVLFSFLTLPMGTIVRLLEKYQQNQKSQDATIGSFNSLYRSVLEASTSSFITEACKDILLYPRSVHENQRRQLKLNIDDTDVLKYYICPNSDSKEFCRAAYSNYCSSRCSCGTLMEKIFEFEDSTTYQDLFTSDKTLFTITDDMVVGYTSMGLTLKTLQGLGYADLDQLHEILVDVDHEKVLALLHCLFSSNTPLTDVFLRKRSSCFITKKQSLPSQERNVGKVISVSVFTRKLDQKILYVESGKDFVDLLFTFLVLPLNSAWKLSGSNIVFGCIGNFCESFKSLSSQEGSTTLTGNCVLPNYYSCQQPLLHVCYSEYYRVLAKTINHQYCHFKPVDPRRNRWDANAESNGFVKRGTTFVVSDDLTITPMNLSSNICSLKKWNMDLGDIEEQVINIREGE
ncbi:unnamed protein product, partial [Thlaspi arvense]